MSGVYINRKLELADAEAAIVPTNRYGRDDYAIQVASGSVLVEGTLTPVNQSDSEVPVWNTLNDSAGAPLAALTDFAVVSETPLEAIRITATGATVCRVMQQGE